MKMPKSKSAYANPTHAMNVERTGPSTMQPAMPAKMPKRSPARKVGNVTTGNYSSDK